MGCKIADNEPLQTLRKDLGLPMGCHSMRKRCVMGMEPRVGDNFLASQGAILGFCQALFANSANAKTHTENLINSLESIDAPWAKSHELFWGYKPESVSINEYLNNATLPLVGSGRVPILISGLEVSKDKDTIFEIMNASCKSFDGETVLLRVVLENKKSITEASELINQLTTKAIESGKMPTWWPLFQTNLSISELKTMKIAIGENWKYVNFAINPFCHETLVSFCPELVTVAQWVIGSLDGINSNGAISLGDIAIFNAKENDQYSLDKYSQIIKNLPFLPIGIILGPSLPGWNDEYNLSRITKYLELIKPIMMGLWENVNDARKEDIWRLQA